MTDIEIEEIFNIDLHSEIPGEYIKKTIIDIVDTLLEIENNIIPEELSFVYYHPGTTSIMTFSTKKVFTFYKTRRRSDFMFANTLIFPRKILKVNNTFSLVPKKEIIYSIEYLPSKETLRLKKLENI